MVKFTLNHKQSNHGWTVYLIQLAALTASYFFTAQVGLSFATVSHNVTLVWPPSGIALAALLIFGYRLWPGITLGALLSNVVSGAPLGFVAGSAAGNTLAALVGAFILRRFLDFRVSVAYVKDVLGLLFLGGVVSTLIAATIGTVSACLSGMASWSLFGAVWSVWWFGDAMGVLVMSPVILSWSTPRPKYLPLRHWLEAAVLLGAVILVSLAVFGDWLGDTSAQYPLAYLAFPLLLWAAFRFGHRGATGISLLIIGMAIWGTTQGWGPFARPSLQESVVLLWIFMGIISVTATLMAAVISESRRFEKDLRKERDFAMRVMNALGQGVVVTDSFRKFEFINPAFAQMLGYAPNSLVGKTLKEVIVAEDHPILQAALDDGYPGKTATHEIRFRHKNGKIVTTLVTASLRYEEGQVTGSIMVITNLTERKQAEQALQDSEARNRALLNAIPDLMLLQDQEGNFLDYYAGDLSSLAFPSTTLVGKNINEVLSPTLLTVANNYFEEILKTGEPQIFEYPFQVNNETLYFECRVVPCGVNRVLSIIRDVTTRRRTEAQFNQLQERFSKAFLANPSAIAITTLVQGIFVDVNPRFLEIFGFEREEVIGRSILDLNILPDSGTRQLIAQTLRTEGRFHNAEIRLRTKSGQLRHTLASMELIELNNKKHVLSMYYDITDRIQAENALRSSEERFRQVIASISDFIYVAQVTPEGYFNNQFVSPKCLDVTGYPPEKFMNEPDFWSALIYAGDRSTAQAHVARLKQGQDSEAEYRVSTVDGRLIWVRDNARPEKDSSTHTIYGVISNITERKQLEEQLHQSQKLEAIGRLAGGIAHDFNNILTVIIGNTELLLDRLSNNTPIRKEIEQINKVGNRAASLTSQLLAFSRQQILEPTIVDLNAIVAEMDKMLRRLIGENIDLITIFDPQLGRIRSDPGQLEQVILNLVVNARDAMPDGGRLIIETANVNLTENDVRQMMGLQPGPHIRLAVSDTGTGMDDETKAHIFEPFFTTKEQGKGTGLGLATIHGIVAQSGGHITVESTPNHGTTFQVYFPQIRDISALNAHKPEMRSAPRESATILVVEDEDMVRSVASRTLAKEGFTVLEANQSLVALNIAADFQQPIHLLLTDVIMPGRMNGRELAKTLRQQRPEIKILYMSGYTDHGIPEGDAMLLQKPFTPQALLRRVHQILDSEI